jgi:hypothetical protein
VRERNNHRLRDWQKEREILTKRGGKIEMRERETERMTYIQTERMMSCLRVAVKNNQQERLCLNERERLFMTKIMYLSEKETETKIECVCVRERDGERDTRGRREGREMINR